jgi:diguanylate cyclase (GGDEF)-like protein
VFVRSAAGIGAIAEPALTVEAHRTCGEIEELFRARPRLRSIVVTSDSRLGLIMRVHFNRVMTGPYGFGRQLWETHPVGEFTDWEPLRVSADTTVVAASHMLRTRPDDARYDDLLVALDGDVVGLVSANRLFDELASQFAERAVRDDLTGLANRAHFLDLLTTACLEATGDSERVAVVFLDLDGMKKINDSQGHHAGDAILMVVGRQLNAALGPGEVAARLGGDEFAVLARVPRQTAPEITANELGRRYLLAVNAYDGRHDRSVRPAASVGVAISGDRADPQTLLSEADMAMYRAKQAGGNLVEVAVGVEVGLSGDVQAVDRSVAQAIAAGELRLHYQPIVRIHDRALMSLEALVRWQHPTMGLLLPGRFLPGARRAGHLPMLDSWVLRTACAEMADLGRTLDAGVPPTINVNVSPPTLAGPVDEVVEYALSTSGLAANQLRIELPEDADLQTLADATPRLERLSTLGVGLTLDDMGAGSTNLRYLSTLSIHGIKIDRAFVAGMLDNPRDHTVVKLLTDLAQGLGMGVTAEGVETAGQLAALAELDVTYAQGNYLATAQPLDQLREVLSAGVLRVAV